MEAGSIGEAKFDWTSCLTGGLNTWGVRPMSVMWGLDTEGGIWGAIIVFKKFGNYVEVNQMSVHLKFFIRQFSVFILIREAEHFLDVRLGDGERETSHDLLEVLLSDEMLVKFVFLCPKVCRERISPAEELKSQIKVRINLLGITTLKAIL